MTKHRAYGVAFQPAGNSSDVYQNMRTEESWSNRKKKILSNDEVEMIFIVGSQLKSHGSHVISFTF